MRVSARPLAIFCCLAIPLGCAGTRAPLSVPEVLEAVKVVRLSDGAKVIVGLMFSFTPRILIMNQGPVSDMFVDDYESCFNRFKLLVQRTVQTNDGEVQETATCGNYSSEWLELARIPDSGNYELRMGFPGPLVNGKRAPFTTSVPLDVNQTLEFITALHEVEMQIEANFQEAAAHGTLHND